MFLLSPPVDSIGCQADLRVVTELRNIVQHGHQEEALKYLTHVGNSLSRKNDNLPYAGLSSTALYNLTVCFMNSLPPPTERKKFASEHISAVTNFLSHADYTPDHEDLIVTQACIMSKVAIVAELPQREWMQKSRPHRLRHLENIVKATDYLMVKDGHIEKEPIRTSPFIFDEKAIPLTKRHRSKFLDVGAYYDPQFGSTTYAYYKDYDVLDKQAQTYELLIHEESHGIDFRNAKESAGQVFKLKDYITDSDLRDLSYSVLGIFEDNMKCFPGKLANKEKAVKQIYRACVAERVAYYGNDIFHETSQDMTIDDALSLKKDLKNCPEQHIWLVESIDEKIRKYKIVGSMSKNDKGKIGIVEAMYALAENFNMFDEKKNSKLPFLEQLAYKALNIPQPASKQKKPSLVKGL